MKNMTYEEKVKFYEKIGAAMTLIYKEKYPSVCKITITQEPSVFIRGVEHYGVNTYGYIPVKEISLKKRSK